MDLSRITTAVPRLLIRLYQVARAGSARRCRFFPSCSDYMLEALETKGLFAGFGAGILRILKCHPWNPGGYDPIQLATSSPAVVGGGPIMSVNYNDGSRPTTCRDDEF